MSPAAAASFVVSIDLEMAWGVWDKITNRDIQLAEQHERPVVKQLLALFARYQVPATWATVGRVFDGTAADTAQQGPAWSAPETVDWILRDDIHELATHGYEHKYFPELSTAQADDELGAVQRAHQKLGAPLTSIVYPRNQLAHVDRLSRVGIKVFRSHDVGLLSVASRGGVRARQLANLIDKCIPYDMQTVHERPGQAATVDLPSSLLLLSRQGVRNWIRPAWITGRINAGLAKAQRDSGCFHLWFHPSNFYYQPEQQFAILQATLQRVASLRDDGKLVTKTMSSFQ